MMFKIIAIGFLIIIRVNRFSASLPIFFVPIFVSPFGVL